MSSADTTIEIIYASVASRPLNPEELHTLTAFAAQANTAMDVTGALVWDRGTFLHLLEDPTDVVDALFGRISADYRHSRVCLISRETISRRTFAGHPLLWFHPTAMELSAITGTDVFVTRGAGFARLGMSAVRNLLAAAWRSQTPALVDIR